MRYFTIYWEADNKKTYAQIIDEKPTDEFEKGKNDFYSEEFDETSEDQLARSIKSVKSLVYDTIDHRPCKKFISELLGGAKIELDSYQWGEPEEDL